MKPGYDQKLYILAFDHRGSFQKKFFGIEGDPDPEQTAMIADAKHLIFEGLQQAVAAGADASVTGVLVDEQFGGTVPEEAHEQGLKLAMPAERRAGCESMTASSCSSCSCPPRTPSCRRSTATQSVTTPSCVPR
jgi:myo-inositol catabolism protein IolC